MLKLAVCDDEPRAVRQLAEMVRVCLPGWGITVFSGGGELLAAAERFDVVLLDIQMEAPNGVETARQLRARGDDAVLIFVTGAKEYVFDAFDVGAFHYLLKPVRAEKLREVLERAADEAAKNRARAEDALLIRTRDRSFAVCTGGILYLESAGRKLILHTEHETIPFYGALTAYEKQLGGGFFRSHRSHLVNLARVVEYDGENIWFANGERAYLARERYGEFVKRYMRFLRNGGSSNG